MKVKELMNILSVFPGDAEFEIRSFLDGDLRQSTIRSVAHIKNKIVVEAKHEDPFFDINPPS